MGPWRARLESVPYPVPVEAAKVYYGILAPLTSTVDTWETEYMHVLHGENPVVGMDQKHGAPAPP